MVRRTLTHHKKKAKKDRNDLKHRHNKSYKSKHLESINMNTQEKELLKRIEISDKKVIHCSDNLIRCNEKTDECMTKVNDYNSKIETLTAELKDVKNRLKNSKKLVEEYRAKTRDNEHPDMSQIITDLNRSNDENKRLTKIMSDYEQLKAKNEVLEAENISHVKNISGMKSSLSILEEEDFRKTRELERVKLQRAEFEKRHEKSSAKLSSVTNELLLLQKERDDLQANVSACLRPGQKQLLNSQLIDIQRKYNDLEIEHARLQSINGKLANQYDAITEENAQLTAEMQVNKADREQLSELLSKSDVLYEELATSKIELKKKNEQISQLHLQASSLQFEIDALKDKEIHLSDQLKNATTESEIKEIKGKLDRCRNEFTTNVSKIEIYRESSEKHKHLADTYKEKVNKLLKTLDENRVAKETIEQEVQLRHALEDHLEECSKQRVRVEKELSDSNKRAVEYGRKAISISKTAAEFEDKQKEFEYKNEELMKRLEMSKKRYEDTERKYKEEAEKSKLSSDELLQRIKEEEAKQLEIRRNMLKVKDECNKKEKDMKLEMEKKIKEMREEILAQQKTLEKEVSKQSSQVKQSSPEEASKILRETKPIPDISNLRNQLIQNKSEYEKLNSEILNIQNDCLENISKTIDHGGDNAHSQIEQILKRANMREAEKRKDLQELETLNFELNKSYDALHSNNRNIIFQQGDNIHSSLQKGFEVNPADPESLKQLANQFGSYMDTVDNLYDTDYNDASFVLKNTISRQKEQSKYYDRLLKVIDKVDDTRLGDLKTELKDRSKFVNYNLQNRREQIQNQLAEIHRRKVDTDAKLAYGMSNVQNLSKWETNQNDQNRSAVIRGLQSKPNRFNRWSPELTPQRFRTSFYNPNPEHNNYIPNVIPLPGGQRGDAYYSGTVHNNPNLIYDGPASRAVQSLNTNDVIMVSYAFDDYGTSKSSQGKVFSIFTHALKHIFETFKVPKRVGMQMIALQRHPEKGGLFVQDVMKNSGWFECESKQSCNVSNPILVDSLDSGEKIIDQIGKGIQKPDRQDVQFVMSLYMGKKTFHVVDVMFDRKDIGQIDLLNGSWVQYLTREINDPQVVVELIFNLFEMSDPEGREANLKLTQVARRIQSFINHTNASVNVRM